MSLRARWHRFGMRHATDRAERLLRKEGLLEIFECGSKKGRATRFPQNFLLYQYIRETQPRTVLEFGSGWTTITIAYALKRNYEDAVKRGGGTIHPKRVPKAYILEANPEWLENTIGNVPEHLREFCEFHCSTPRASTFEGELTVSYDELPNISPELILLDGPSPTDVAGSVKGLSFLMGRDIRRAPVVSDLLLYESTFASRATIMIESRFPNAMFLMRHLKKTYKITFLPSSSHFVFEYNRELASTKPTGIDRMGRLVKRQLRGGSRFTKKSAFALLP